MEQLKGNCICERCKTQFEWYCPKPGTYKYYYGKIDDISKNVSRVVKSRMYYVVEIKCPKCLHRQFENIE